MNINNSRSPIVVVYDGSCPLCSREIAHYRRRHGAHALDWVDASADLEGLEALGLSQQAALARFHVRAADHSWRTGASGFVLLWSQLRPYRFLAAAITHLRLLPWLERGYTWFLRRRNARQCTAESCGDSRSP